MDQPSPKEGWERLFWLVFRRSASAVALADDQRRVIDVNDAAVGLLGRGRAELLGLPVVEMVAPGERVESARQWKEFLHSGEYSGSRDLLRPDGSMVKLDFAARLADVDGRRLAIYVLMPKQPSWPTPSLRSAASALTKREREVVTLIAMGRETDDIAEQLNISPETVRTHVRNSLSKLGAHTRAQLVAIVLSSDETIHGQHVNEPGRQ